MRITHTRIALLMAAAAVAGIVGLAVASDSHAQTTSISNLTPATQPLTRSSDLTVVVQCTGTPTCTRKVPVSAIYDPASPGNLGATAPGTARFTNLDLSGSLTGLGFANYLAAPPTIGGSVPGQAYFSILQSASLVVAGSVSGSGFTSLITSQFAVPPALGSTTPNAVTGTTVTATGKVNGATGVQVAGIDLCNATLPTVGGTGLGTSPSVSAASSCSADVTVGTGPAAASFTITLPTAPHGWTCQGWDITTISTTVFQLRQIAGGSATTCLMQVTNTSAVVQAPVAGDHLKLQMLPQ